MERNIVAQLTFLLGEHLAKASPQPENAVDWMTTDRDLPSDLLSWLQKCAPATSSGKTSPEFLAAETDATLKHFWDCSLDGVSVAVSSEILESLSEPVTPTASHGECLMLNTSEFHSDAAVCLLSDILIGEVPPKYYLSPRACSGILRRAEKRNKPIMPWLKAALQSQSMTKPPDTQAAAIPETMTDRPTA